MFRSWIFALFLFPSTVCWSGIHIQSEAACLIDGNTGEILYEKDAHTERYPASITKIATALMVLTQADLDLNSEVTADQDSLGWVAAEKKKKSNYTLPAYWLEPDGTQLGVQVGEVMTTRDLLYGMMLGSCNDCANLLAKQHSEEVPLFMERLNAYLKDEVGCRKTHFNNPHGLFHPEHKTTAHDMALIAKAAMELELFRSVVASKEYLRQPTNKTVGGDAIRQGNKLLRPGAHLYKSAVGIKTGYVQMAKHTFVGAAKREGRLLISVLLGNEDRNQMFQDSIKLLEEGFQIPRHSRTLFAAGPQGFSRQVRKGGKVKGLIHDDVVIHYYEGREPDITCQIEWAAKLSAPIEKGELVGHLFVRSEEKLLAELPVYAADSVERSKQMRYLPWVAGASVLFLMSVLVWELRKKR